MISTVIRPNRDDRALTIDTVCRMSATPCLLSATQPVGAVALDAERLLIEHPGR